MNLFLAFGISSRPQCDFNTSILVHFVVQLKFKVALIVWIRRWDHIRAGENFTTYIYTCILKPRLKLKRKIFIRMKEAS